MIHDLGKMGKHPTDKYIHWNMSDKEAKKVARKLRKAYDKIIAAKLKKELEILLAAAPDEDTGVTCGMH